jgi:DNA-binding NarL/FixJ family response regulator
MMGDNNKHNIKVLVADSAPIFAFGLVQALSTGERIEVIGHAHNGQEVLDKTEELDPDVVVMDVNLAGHNGIQVTEMLRDTYPEVKVIILTPPENAENLFESAIGAGAKGYLSKNINPMDLVKGVIETADMGAAICPTMIPLLLEKLAERRIDKPVIGLLLSAREREVMELVAEGMGNREIAEALVISENTVKGHLRRIIDKLKVNNRVEVARYVLLNGLLEHDLSEHELEAKLKG